MQTTSRKWVALALITVVAAAAGAAWWKLRPAPLAPGLAMANGRIDVAVRFCAAPARYAEDSGR